MDAVKGTVKVGRWTYTAERREDGIVNKQNKDGSWTLLGSKEGANFVPDNEAAPVELPKLSAAAQALATMIAQSTSNPRGEFSFDFFDDGLSIHSGIWLAHMAEQTPAPVGAVVAAYELEKAGLVDIGPLDQAGDDKDRWLALTPLGVDVIATFVNEKIDITAIFDGTIKEGNTVAKTTGNKIEGTGKCGCGCKGNVASKRFYRPGHDARHAGQVARAAVELPKTKRAALLKELPTANLQAKAAAQVERILARAK